jgi:hypothetical protein
MNWAILALLCWLFLGLEAGFRDALQVGALGVAPSFVLILVVFISLWAKPAQALGIALAMGFFMDLLRLVPTSAGENAAIVGPWTLGCLVAAYTVLNFRAMVFRRNPLTMAFLCTLGSTVASVMVVAVLTLRSFYDVVQISSASRELWLNLGCALYTGVVGLVVGPALNSIGPWLGFRKQMQSASAWRGRP